MAQMLSIFSSLRLEKLETTYLGKKLGLERALISNLILLLPLGMRIFAMLVGILRVLLYWLHVLALCMLALP